MYGAGDVRVDQRPDPSIQNPTGAVVRVVAAGIRGSDLHPYGSMTPTNQGRPMGHEFIGTVEDVGSEVSRLSRGDLVLSPFTYADNTCAYCRDGLQTSCPNGGRYGLNGVDGGQGEAVGVPQGQGTLITLPADVDSSLLPARDVVRRADGRPSGARGDSAGHRARARRRPDAAALRQLITAELITG